MNNELLSRAELEAGIADCKPTFTYHPRRPPRIWYVKAWCRRSLLLGFFVVSSGCAAQFGEDGKIFKYDLCGFVGGVALEVGALQSFNFRLGCTDPEDVELEEVPE